MLRMKKIFVNLLLFCGLFFCTENINVATTLSSSKNLKYGSKSAQVKILQSELNKVMNCKLKVDDINDKFYYIDDMYFITIFEEKYNEFKQGLSKKRKKFNIGEIKTMVEKFTISKFKDLLSGGKKLDYGRRSTK